MQFLWHIVAQIFASYPGLVDWVIRRAQRTPYSHIMSADGQSRYMGRWWLFNPYCKDAQGNATPARWAWLPSMRVHHIMRPDQDRDLHDHPWNARTIVLRGWYSEERPVDEFFYNPGWTGQVERDGEMRDVFMRRAGYTGRLLFGQYHRISAVSEGGVWTLFITWRYRGTWGFLVDGKKVPWRTYLGIDKGPSA